MDPHFKYHHQHEQLFFRLFLWKSATKSVSPFTALAPIIGCISTTACHWAKVIKTWQINWIKINVLAVLTLPTQNLSMLAPAGTLMINLHEILKVMNDCFYTFAAARWSGMSGEAGKKKARRRLREERGFFVASSSRVYLIQAINIPPSDTKMYFFKSKQGCDHSCLIV